MFKINDFVRVKRDDPNNAPVKAGDSGTVVHIEDYGTDSTYKVRFPNGKVWHFVGDDLEVVNVYTDFSALVAGLNMPEGLEAFYEAPEPAQGVPVEPFIQTEAEAEAEAEDDEDDHDCGSVPHAHDADGSVVPLPYAELTDDDGDVLQVVTIGEIPQAARKGVTTSIRVFSPRLQAVLEVHLTTERARQIGYFLLAQNPE